MVEGTTGHAHVILDALGRDDPACEVILKHDGLEALDYLLCRGAYARRDTHIMPCVTLIDLALPPSDGLELLREMRAHEQTKILYPWSYSPLQKNIYRLMPFTLQGPIATLA